MESRYGTDSMRGVITDIPGTSCPREHVAGTMSVYRSIVPAAHNCQTLPSMHHKLITSLGFDFERWRVAEALEDVVDGLDGSGEYVGRGGWRRLSHHGLLSEGWVHVARVRRAALQDEAGERRKLRRVGLRSG